MSTQSISQPTVTVANSFPTPASSVSGVAKDVAEPSEKSGRHVENGGPTRDINGSFSQTQDHRQQNEGSGPSLDEDPMDVDQNTNALKDPSIAALQQDVGEAFHLCKTSYSISGPNPSLDLVSLYGLGPVAASVARTDPVTGEKINRLRKSYEGKIKGLGLSGRNKPVKREEGMPGLRDLTMWPEEEWQNQKVFGKEIKVADPDSSFSKLHMRAMKFEMGPVPDNEYWEDILGHEKPTKNAATSSTQPKKASDASGSMPRQYNLANGTPMSGSNSNLEASRPRRTGKKRSYNDSSFIGYGEGFPDDEAETESAFYSNSEEGGRVSGKKKRKKDHVSAVPPLERGGSYGVGMFGVGAR